MQNTNATLEDRHDRKPASGRKTANGAVWSLLLPSADRILCHADIPPPLAFEVARRGAHVDIVTRRHLEAWQSATQGEPRLRCLSEPDPETQYDLALLWDPAGDRDVRAWLADLGRLRLAPREVAIRIQNPWGVRGLTWPIADLRLRRAGWTLGAAHLALPEADRVRQLVEWQDYAHTPLIRHRRSHRAWKAQVVRSPLWRWLLPARMRRAHRRSVSPVGSVLDAVLADAGQKVGSALRVERLLVSPNGIAIASVRSDGAGETRAILKIPYALAAEGRAARNAEALQWLAARSLELGARTHGSWAGAPPRLLASGSTRGWAYTLEEHVDGEVAQGWSEAAGEDAMKRLAGFLGVIARLGERSRPLDAEALDRAVGAPTRCTAELLEPQSARRMRALGEMLSQALEGVTVPRVPRHGDFKLESVLGTPLAEGPLRIVDWELWSPCGLPLLDFWHLVASRRARAEGCSMGTAVRRWVMPGALTTLERELFERASRGIDPRYVALSPVLYWLDRLGPVAARGAWPRDGWERPNVLAVLYVAERTVAKHAVAESEVTVVTGEVER